MRSDDVPEEDGGGRPGLEAAVAGLAAFFAAALAAGLFDGGPLAGLRGWMTPGSATGPAVAGGPGPPPVAHLCFRGPGGEPVDFSIAPDCPRSPAGAGPRLAGMP